MERSQAPRLNHLCAEWRAAMRGRRLTVPEDMLYQLLAKVPPKAVHALVVFIDDDGVTCVRWMGYSPEAAAMTLYAMADEIIRQRVPLP